MISTSLPSLSQSARPFPLPTVAEDTLHYAVHLPSSDTDSDPAAFATLITQHVESLLTQPWLWNKDAWELKVSSESLSKLEGTMRVGDAVDDEWLVVWLLREISRKWAELVISVRDSDGEFLLIEAANELPAWVTPENAHNRLWLHNGHLHLIPLNVRSSATSRPRQLPDDDNALSFDPEAWINEDDAVRAVRTGKYIAEPRMEQAVWERITGYPEALRTHLHRTKAWLPVPIARALRVDPSLIQKAVEGFYVRDPAQLRSASRMTHFPPAPAVLSSVILTRAAYAQLQGQVFHPPRVFGAEWSVREGAELDNERRWRDLGVKIATGFEIMYKEGGRKGKGGEMNDDDVRSDPAYEKYIGNLAKAGFFGTEVQGSAKWKLRETEALRGWKALKIDDNSAHRPSFAFQVDQALRQTDAVPVSGLEVSADAPEDSDSWLEVSPDELDGMLLRASGKPQNGAATEGENSKMDLGPEHGQALQDLAQKVEQFVGGQGDLEGAKFADELSDEDMEDDEDDDEQQSGLTAEEKAAKVRELIPSLATEEWGRRDPPSRASEPSEKPAPSIRTAIQDASDPRRTMRPPVFAKEEYDGVVDESDSDEEDELPVAGSIGRKIAQMRWADTAPKIEEIDEAEEDEARRRGLTLGDDIDEAMVRNVARTNGEEDDEDEAMELELDPDMLDEQEEFLKFAREALGISGDAWEDMLSDRRDRGAFVPGVKAPSKPSTNKKVSFDEPPKPKASRKPGEPDESLDSFDKVMEAMEAELDRHLPTHSQSAPSAKRKPKAKVAQSLPNPNEAKGPLPNLPTAEDLDDMSDEELAAMDRELRSALKGAGLDSDEEEEDEDDEGGVPEARELVGEDKREYRMMRDLLESYTSQAGQSGVVGNLFGRLGEGGRGV